MLLGVTPLAMAATAVAVIGPGNDPSVAVDGAGTAFIAYNDNANTGAPPDSLHYCRLPRGQGYCDVRLTFAVDGTALSRPQVFVDGQTVRILTYSYGLTGPQFALDFVLTSTDGGVTFGAPVAVGTLSPYDAIAGPGPTGISMVTENNGNAPYQRVDANGPVTTASANFGSAYTGQMAVGLVNPATPMVTLTDSASAAFRVYVGSGDVNDPANWSAAQPIGTGQYPRMAGGPSGLFLQTTADTMGINPRLDVRRYDGSSFGAPISIPIGDGGAFNYLTQDAGGTLYSVWPDNTCASGCPTLRYASSADGVSSWRVGDMGTFAQQVNNPWAAVAPDHLGVAVFDTAQGTARQVRAVALASILR